MTLARRTATVILLTSVAVLTGLGAATLIQWTWNLRHGFNEWTDGQA